VGIASEGRRSLTTRLLHSAVERSAVDFSTKMGRARDTSIGLFVTRPGR
jgi:hypothetical protein